MREITLDGFKFTMGPACTELHRRSEKMLRLVLARANGMTLSAAAEAAGYTTSATGSKRKRALTDTASQTLQAPHCQAALHEVTAARIKGNGGRAIRVIENIAFGGGAPAAVQLKAAQDLANRAGHAPVQQIAVDHTHRAERRCTLEDLFRSVGVEMPDSLRQIAGPVVDAEFEVIEPAPSTAGLEDLLEIPTEEEEPDDGQAEVEDHDLVFIQEDDDA